MEDKALKILGKVHPIPGTEVVRVETVYFILMEYRDVEKNKQRHAIVDKTVREIYHKTLVDSQMRPIVALVSKRVFEMLAEVLIAANRQISTLKADLAKVTDDLALYRSLIETLRQNGVID